MTAAASKISRHMCIYISRDMYECMYIRTYARMLYIPHVLTYTHTYTGHGSANRQPKRLQPSCCDCYDIHIYMCVCIYVYIYIHTYVFICIL